MRHIEVSTYGRLLAMCHKQNHAFYRKTWYRDKYQKPYVGELTVTSNVKPFPSLEMFFGPSGRVIGGVWHDSDEPTDDGTELTGGRPVFTEWLDKLLELSKLHSERNEDD